jgi:uncharacterized protein YabN with tetrapyrrole methylase and pyrophosphatase domain
MRRFAVVERIAAERGMDLTRMTAPALEALWQEAKRLVDGDTTK